MENVNEKGKNALTSSLVWQRRAELSRAEAQEALAKAKEAEARAVACGRLVMMRTLNGTVWTTDPKRYEEYNKQYERILKTEKR